MCELILTYTPNCNLEYNLSSTVKQSDKYPMAFLFLSEDYLNIFEEYLDAPHKRVKRREKTLKGDNDVSKKALRSFLYNLVLLYLFMNIKKNHITYDGKSFCKSCTIEILSLREKK